ncbi:hypothetical protein GGI07_001724 [Coemansia sp. Benny D115]|nr:hypothetical protein GGI07_001724 [Coemansia sp. Benny D115]
MTVPDNTTSATDATTGTIPNAIYELTPADGNPASRANMPFVYFYSLPSAQQTPDLRNKLRESYYQVMQHYPILYGKIERQPVPGSCDKARIIVDDETKIKLAPVYDEYEIHDILIKDIREANYNWSKWPQQILDISAVRHNGASELPLSQCVITWHPDGVGILFSVDHSVSDGAGMATLFNQWASIMRTGELALPVDFDRMSMYQQIANVKPDTQNWFVKHVNAIDLNKVAGQSEAIIDSSPLSPQQIEQGLRQNVHAMRVTAEALERLRADSNHGVAPGANKASMIYLAYALFWQRYIVALQKTRGADDQSDACLLNLVYGTRDMVDRPYLIGNAASSLYMQQTRDKLGKETLRNLAIDIGQDLQTRTKALWVAVLEMLRDPVTYLKFISVFGNPHAMQLTISNISKLTFYDADFGFGRPEHITVFPVLIPGFTVWHPLSHEGGLHIIWNLSHDVLAQLSADEQFTKYVDILF